MIRDGRMAETMLRAVGDRLAEAGSPATIIVLGGVAMNLHGFVDRSTHDVDVLARREEPDGPLRHPEPLPPALRTAIREVALDFDQPPDWMNTVVARQWDTGLPPGLERRLTWRSYSALEVGLVAREDLIAFKLYAAADHGPRSVHVSDLVALRPTTDELAGAAAWIRTQDTSPEFHTIVERVTEHVRQRLE